MKKSYTAPNVLCMNLGAIEMIALSLNSTETISSDNMSDFEQSVKSSTPSNSNVWDDDWSK